MVCGAFSGWVQYQQVSRGILIGTGGWVDIQCGHVFGSQYLHHHASIPICPTIQFVPTTMWPVGRKIPFCNSYILGINVSTLHPCHVLKTYVSHLPLQKVVVRPWDEVPTIQGLVADTCVAFQVLYSQGMQCIGAKHVCFLIRCCKMLSSFLICIFTESRCRSCVAQAINPDPASDGAKQRTRTWMLFYTCIWARQWSAPCLFFSDQTDTHPKKNF